MSTPPPLHSPSPPTTFRCPSSVWRPTKSSHRSVRERAGAQLSPFSTKHTGKASCRRLGNVNRTSFTLVNTSSTTGPPRPCNFDRRARRTAVCAWVPLNASSPATRAPVFGLLDTAMSPPANVDSPVQRHHPAYRRLLLVQGLTIVFGRSEKIPRTLHFLDSVQFASWTTPDRSSSRSFPLGMLRLLEPFAARGVCKCTKKAPSCVVLCAT